MAKDTNLDLDEADINAAAHHVKSGSTSVQNAKEMETDIGSKTEEVDIEPSMLEKRNPPLSV